jgi:hypothetical protein
MLQEREQPAKSIARDLAPSPTGSGARLIEFTPAPSLPR